MAQRVARMGFLDWDMKTNVVYWSDELIRLIGIAPGQNLQTLQSTAALTHPDDRALARASVERAVVGEAPHSMDHRMLRADGTVMWVHSEGELIQVAAGTPSRFLITLVDITRRKNAEEEVKKGAQRLRNLIDGLGPSMFVGLLTPDGTLIEANQPALAAAGLTLQDVLGKPLEETYWLSHSDETRRQFRAAITRAASGEPSRFDVQIRGVESQFITIDFSLQPIRDEAGQVVFLVPSASVITERKHAEEALRTSEERFRQLAENIQEVFWLTDPGMQQMLYISPAYETIWGRSCASLYADPQSWRDAILPEDRERVANAALTKQLGGNYDEEYRILRPDGTSRWIRDRAFPVHDAQGRIYRVSGVAEDITERRHAATALRESEERSRVLV